MLRLGSLELDHAVDREHPASVGAAGACEALLARGDVVRVTRSTNVSRFLRLRAPHYFFAAPFEGLANDRG